MALDREADDFFSFIADVSGTNKGERHLLQVMHGVGGERSLVEEELHHLSGYDHARPVRIGNGAYNQMQHDIWGSMLDSVYLHARSREQIPERLWPVLKQQVEEAIKHWREPDRGIWEVRGEPQHFTSSKIMCWVALDRGAKLAELHGWTSYTPQWRAIAEQIKADILANGVDSRGVLIQRYGDDALGASLLLAVLTRFLPADDPRLRATVLAIADELTEEGLVLRYRVHETDDGLSGEEGTFTICSFWLVSALVEIGEIRRARHLFEGLLSFASPLHLYAEEIEPRTGRHLGNFPQAFTHLALINAVVRSWPTRHRAGRRCTGCSTPKRPRSWPCSRSGARSTARTASSPTAAPTWTGCGCRRRRCGGFFSWPTSTSGHCPGPATSSGGRSRTGRSTPELDLDLRHDALHRVRDGGADHRGPGLAQVAHRGRLGRGDPTQVEIAFTAALEAEGLLEAVEAPAGTGRVDLDADDENRPDPAGRRPTTARR